MDWMMTDENTYSVSSSIICACLVALVIFLVRHHEEIREFLTIQLGYWRKPEYKSIETLERAIEKNAHRYDSKETHLENYKHVLENVDLVQAMISVPEARNLMNSLDTTDQTLKEAAEKELDYLLSKQYTSLCWLLDNDYIDEEEWKHTNRELALEALKTIDSEIEAAIARSD